MKYIYNSNSLPPLDARALRGLDDAAIQLSAKLSAFKETALALSEEARQAVANFKHDGGETMRKHVHLKRSRKAL